MDGKGVAFPIAFDATGALAESSGTERIRQAVVIVLGTRPGERIMRPEFGCELHSLAFAPNTPATANLARHYVSSALARWEPRIEVTEIAVANDPRAAALTIDLTYRIRGNDGRQTLTLRFPLEQPS
ncbi:GPW/gp25 family protein [Streptomyces chartreusis]|uniref:GPW/gp25 family protein n=1 Tax=Streptomyces chartreusis TaxID=1969 RepID=UPI00387057DA|nr:GPW/gp25 family protein [Streptomyces chartreusis]